MATIAGSIKSLSNGVFNVKDENGNIRVLKVGDEIYENDTVYGDNGNTAVSQIEILLSGNDVIVLNEGQKQLIDSSLIETAFGKEELFFTREGLDLKADEHNSNADVVSDLRDAEFTNVQKDANDDSAFADANNSDVTNEKTAEGEEEVEDETTGNAQFEARDGNATDIVSDLRNAQFRARTQVFEDKSLFENESKDRLTTIENTDRPSYTNPPVTPTTPPNNPTPPSVLPPIDNIPPTIITPPTPPTVIVPPTVTLAKLSVNDVTAYESEGFLIFTVTLDKSNSSDVTFDYVTSPLTATNGGVDYTDVTGKITIPAGSTSVTIKVPITDDYISDNGETMQINILNVVGNVTVPKPVGIGTILDNTNTDNPGGETGGYGPEDTIYAIIVGPREVIEGNTTTKYTVKLVDKDGNPATVTKETDVTVIYKNITTQNEDTEYNDGNTITVKIPANSSTGTFTVDTIDDYLADNGENYNVEITNVEDTGDFENVVIGDKDGNFKDVTTTILDNSKDTPTDPYDQTNIPPVETDLDTITIKLFAIDSVTGARVAANEVFEGNSAEYIAVAFDKNGNEVLQGETVSVTFGKTGDTATAGGVDYVSTTQTVTIGTKFNTPTTDDYMADNGEVYSVQITDKTLSNAATYETVIIDTTSVTTTILDDSQPNTPNNPGDPVEPNMESVVVKLVSTDAQGNIIPEATIPEGETAYYKAILVDPSGNQIVDATGTVAITFTDGTAIRTGTTTNGTDDFTATNQTVTINTVFSAVAKDDYIADSGEKFNVQITDDTYSNASIYENVTHDTTPLVTTITDNSKPNGNTPHDPNDTPNHTTEGNKEIVTIKLFAADSSGNVIKDGSGNYVLANTAEEGSNAKYIAYAFNYGQTTFNDTTKLATQVGKVNVSFTDGTAKGVDTTQTITDGSQDFNNKTQTIIIGESFNTEVFNDVLKEGNENYTVKIDNNSYAVDTVKGGYESVTIDNSPVTTTINDSSVPMKVFVKIEPVTDTVNESGELEYKVTLVDVDGNEVNVPTGKSITVDLTYINDTTSNNDYTTPTTQVTITGGSSTNFTVPTVDDYFAEGGESLKIEISNITGDTTVFEEVLLHTTANGATNDKVEVDGTIKDNPANKVKENPGDTPTTGIPNEPTDPSEPVDPTDNPPIYGTEDTVYVKITKTPSTIEGGDLVHTVTLVDKNGNVVEVPTGKSVTVDLTYTVNSGNFTEGDLSTIIKTVTITGGTNHTDFTNITKDDFTAEGDEVYTVTITDVSQTGAFENVVIADATAPDAVKNLDSTTGTIKDGVILGTPVDVKVDEDDFVITDTTPQISKSENLGITTPNTDEGYTLSFDNTITVFKGDATSSETNIYGDSTGLKSGGVEITYEVNGDTITGKAGSETVFTITLNKNATGGSDDNYTYTQYKNIDHPVSGPVTNNVNDDDITFEFGFNITDQNQTSSTQKFKVTVNDSMPVSGTKEVAVVEDSLSTTPANTFIISQENFKDGKIEISNDGGSTWKTLTQDGTGDGKTIDIKDPNDATKTVGTLTNNGDGTVTFVPIEDYSNYNAKPTFSYKVSDNDGDYAEGIVNITVKPVADAPDITLSTPTMVEDNTNANEGTHQVALGFIKPALSKDTTDENTTNTGDKPEKNGEITLIFTNGDKVTGAKIFKADGTTQVGSDITTTNQTLKVVIVTSSGGTDIDYDYHHADITALNPSGNVVYLTQGEYQGLKIQHAEDNDTDIKIKIGVTSYELDDGDKPLNASDSSYADKENTDLSKTTEKTMTVKIHPATDDISLIWDTATGGTFTGNTFTFDSKAEGEYFDTPIDLKAILTKTSGTQNDATPLGGDLDGSEKRTYTVEGIPEGTVITVGTQTAVAGSDGIATLVFNNINNKDADPEFSMKLPEHYSGTITDAKITLSVQDQGVDSGDTPSSIKTAEVYFNVVVNPIADIATIQVKQSVGFEDAGRDGGNTIEKDGTIDNVANGIPLDIKVSSDDKDGSEKFDVTISDIPTDAVIYYGGVLQAQTGNSITIVDFDNATSLVIIPPHNSDADFPLTVSAKTIDGTDVSAPTVTTIDVIVKNVADAPVGTELKTDIKVDEDNQLNLKDVYTDSTALKSYDDSEVLTVKIDLPTGFTIDSGSPYYVEDGMYVVKASDIQDGKIKLNVPENFSGEASFDLTYVTTEKAGEGDSKTWNTDPVSIFVNPIADDVTVAESSTINEDADGSTNKIDLKPILTDTDGSESVTSVKILASSVGAGYELFLGSANGTSIASKLVGLYYELTPAEADSVYAKNTSEHDADSGDNFTLSVIYTVKDTATGTADVTNDFTHTHTVNVQAITDNPTLNTETITQVSGNVAISDTTVTVNAENSQFKVPVTTTSPDGDGSETVQKIVISGVPMGVSVEGATYYGYSGSEHNGIWVITSPSDSSLDNSGLQDITFTVNEGANFENREITITTYTKDINAEVKSASQTINIVKNYTPGNELGEPAELELTVIKEYNIQEDTEFSLAKVLGVNEVKTGDSTGGAVITFTDIPDGSTVSGYDYSYEEGGKTYYVVVGAGNAADMNTKLDAVKITTPKDMNSNQVAPLQGDFTFTADIATHHGGGFNNGNQVTSPETTQDIAPLTDAMTVAVSADNINEDGRSNLSITLSNPSDGTKTELVGSSLTITVNEIWKDSGINGEGTSGILTQTGTDYNIIDNNDGTFTITKTDNSPFTVDTPITGLQYIPAENRDGDVNFKVSVKNKETGSNLELDSIGNKTITVRPEIDIELNASLVTANVTEDTVVTVGSTTLGNPVKLDINTTSIVDGSEKFGNIILDEVPNGFTVWYKVGTELVMATNIGLTGGGTFDTNPAIIGDAEVTKNKWLVPATVDGSMPEVYINAPENWSGDFDFNAVFSVKEQNLTTSTSITVDVTGHIHAVADGVTIAPTLTFGDAFSWVDLKLNANMVDVDGSETMSLEITGLDDMAQFRLADGTAVNASLDGVTWKLDGIAFDQINNIQFAHDKGVVSVGIKAKTVDSDGTATDESSFTDVKTFELSISDVSGIFKLDDGLSLNFDNIDALSSVNTLKNIDTIDLTETGENKLENLSLQDVLDMTDSSNTLKITGTSEDKVSFNGSWTKTIGTDGSDTYSSTDGTNTVQVKVEQDIPVI